MSSVRQPSAQTSESSKGQTKSFSSDFLLKYSQEPARPGLSLNQLVYEGRMETLNSLVESLSRGDTVSHLSGRPKFQPRNRSGSRTPSDSGSSSGQNPNRRRRRRRKTSQPPSPKEVENRATAPRPISNPSKPLQRHTNSSVTGFASPKGPTPVLVSPSTPIDKFNWCR